MREEIKRLIKEELSQIETWLQRLCISQHPFINQVSEYILFSGGKRIRPLLCVLSAKALGEDSKDQLYQTSLLFEYLHVATLLHDDVVDSAEFRRGRKAARNLWGNQATILVGDYLYAKALKIASSLKNPNIMEAITETTFLMSEGEILQLLHLDDTYLSEASYNEIIYRKTAALISCSCKVGAILSGGSSSQVDSLGNYGLNLGMAFQIIDDLLDYLGSETGKDRGKDFREGKITLPVILALDSASETDRERLITLLKKRDSSQEDFQIAFSIIEKNGGFQRSLQKAKDFTMQAKEFLKEIPDSLYKDSLFFIADFILERKK
ncbi:MAG: polyprenyl synthetase family protein [Caldimicrobium sp.]|nr:polyprenyl synthetase family protein [Caldimicrobium sp.]MCX7873682.1 polyprenyl synthetase family protein [Caldimicrobium sp.]MDW8095095.1 polyprenyl synthetase family protein [Caldimicrobium sp.]